jgi:predicted 3-demethylubiquinone-9 3-methyltransferase (glyoxalase superfamily)
MTSVTPFLWFDKDALPAAEFYTSLIPNSEIKEVNRSPVSGDVFSLTFTVAGREFFALNGGPHFEFTPAISLFVECADQTEVDKYWEALTADGGEESRCGWLIDKWGLSWQIVPTRLGEVLSNPDPIKAKAAMEAMLQMNKIIVAELNVAVGE